MNKHYNTLDDYYKKRFGEKIFKISLNANFTCPHQGCTFCSPKAYNNATISLEEQFQTTKAKMHQKWPNGKYIAYFQANTNTYAPLKQLKALYDNVINLDPNIKMIAISTRADCLDDEKIAYFKDLNQKIPIQIELGLQTIHPQTSRLINRQEDLATIKTTIQKLLKANIETVIHIINGLPYETPEMMLQTAEWVAKTKCHGIKIHMLHLIQKTPMAQDYLKNPWPILTLEQYVDITIKQLQILPKTMIIHRITGDAPKDLLITPLWTLKKFVVLNEIDKKMRQHALFQGQFSQDS